MATRSCRQSGIVECAIATEPISPFYTHLSRLRGSAKRSRRAADPCDQEAFGVLTDLSLLVMADDMGWTDLGAYGGEVDTPHLDQLAKRGVTFTDFHVSVAFFPVSQNQATHFLHCGHVTFRAR